MARVTPWDGFPKTSMGRDCNGKTFFSVRPRVLTPERAKIAHVGAIAIALALNFYGVVFVSHASEPPLWAWFAALLLPWIFRSSIYDAIAGLISKETKLVLTEQDFEIHGVVGKRVYDRTLDHAFSVYAHDQAEAEARSDDLKIRQAAQKGNVIKRTPYFADSAVVSFDYLGQRNDVLTVYPKTAAVLVLSRLQACDAVLNRQLGGGDGFATDPSDQWGEQPGNLFEDE